MGPILAVTASLCFVALDVLRKILGRSLGAAPIVIAIHCGGVPVFLVLLFWHDTFSWDATFLLVASIESVTHAVASVLFVRAVILSPLSLTVPYLGLTPVVSLAVAFAVLGERPQAAGLAGIILVVAGAVSLHLGRLRSFRELLTAPLREPGSWRMMVVAAIWGSTTSLDKIAIAHASEIMLALFLSAGSSLVLAAAWAAGLWKKSSTAPGTAFPWGLLALAALIGAAAVLCQFLAYRELLVPYVETIKRAGGLFSALIGVVAFREGGFRYRVPAAILIVVGAALILLPL